MSEELKPCPFCGGKVVLKRRPEIACILCESGTSCDNSGLVIAFSPEKENAAVAQWNRRSLPANERVRDEWISVEERLPAEETMVLVTGWAWDKPGGDRFQTTAALCEDKKWREPGSAVDEHVYMPTHWMPLPAAPVRALIGKGE